MVRYISLAAAAAISTLAPFVLRGANGISAPELTVGRNLQVSASIALAQPAPPEGLELTLTSDDPARLSLAAAPNQAGSPSIILKAPPRSRITPEFWVHGLDDRGSATYSIIAPGVGSAKGAVRFAPSGIAILGPFHLPSFPTTPRGAPSKLTIVSTLLDSSRKIVEEQQIAGGLTVEVAITNSNAQAGALGDSQLTLVGGESFASTYFKPAAEGSSTLTANQPPGFTSPAESGNVIAMVERAGVAISDELTIGKDLQLLGVVCLGEAAPEGGLQVTLTSSNGGKLLLSAHEDKPGSASLTLTVPRGEFTAIYYLQALSDSGSVTYNATAPGFRHRIAKIDLAPSGMIIAYEHYGPPDEAAVLRGGAAAQDERRFYASVAESKERPVNVAVYSAQLDPASGLAADITVQPLRAGVSAKVELTSSNTAVGALESPLTIAPGTNRALSRFTPLSAGETVLSIRTPAGFSTPKNATSVPATVTP